MSYLRFCIPMDGNPWQALADLVWAAEQAGGRRGMDVVKRGELRVVVSHPIYNAGGFWAALVILRHVRSLTYPNPEGF